MPTFCDPHFLVYRQNRIRSFLYMDRIFEFVHIRENTDEKKPTKTSLYVKTARYKEVSAIKGVHCTEVLPYDEFIMHQFSINRTYVRYFDRNSALFNFVFR